MCFTSFIVSSFRVSLFTEFREEGVNAQLHWTHGTFFFAH